MSIRAGLKGKPVGGLLYRPASGLLGKPMGGLLGGAVGWPESLWAESGLNEAHGPTLLKTGLG